MPLAGRKKFPSGEGLNRPFLPSTKVHFPLRLPEIDRFMCSLEVSNGGIYAGFWMDFALFSIGKRVAFFDLIKLVDCGLPQKRNPGRNPLGRRLQPGFHRKGAQALLVSSA
jgi:hypothetical protein